MALCSDQPASEILKSRLFSWCAAWVVNCGVVAARVSAAVFWMNWRRFVLWDMVVGLHGR